MNKLSVLLEIPQKISDGLKSGIYERVGGVIVTKDKKTIVGWLRESGEAETKNKPSLIQTSNLLSCANLAISAINLGATFYYGSKNLQNTNKILNEVSLTNIEIKKTQEMIDLNFKKLNSRINEIVSVSNKTDLSISLIKLRDAFLLKEDNKEIKKIILEIVRYIPNEMSTIISSSSYCKINEFLEKTVSLLKVIYLTQGLTINYFDSTSTCIDVMKVIQHDPLIERLRSAIAENEIFNFNILASAYMSLDSYTSVNEHDREVIFDLFLKSNKSFESDKAVIEVSDSDNIKSSIIHDKYSILAGTGTQSDLINFTKDSVCSDNDIAKSYISGIIKSGSETKKNTFFKNRAKLLNDMLFNGNNPVSFENMNADKIKELLSAISNVSIANELSDRISGINIELSYCNEKKLSISDYQNKFIVSNSYFEQPEYAFFER